MKYNNKSNTGANSASVKNGRVSALIAGTLMLLLFAHAGVIHAVQPPDAGRTSQELQARPPPPAKSMPHLDIEQPTRAPLAAPAGLKIQVTGFRITGARLYPESELQALLQGAVGRELGLAELETEAARITAYYRARGYPFARAYLPAQDIKDGTVEINVLEGRYGKISINNKTAVPDRLMSAALNDIQPDAVIAAASLERGLLLLSEIPGVEVKSTLTPGASVGTADLVAEAVPGKRFSGSLDADNYGNRFTGEYRLGASLNFANPTHLGDLLTLRALSSGDGLHYARLGWQAPLGGQGTRGGIAYSDMGYKLGRDFASLDAHGSARIGTAFVQHPFIRSRAANLYGQASYDHKRLDDRIDTTATIAQKTLRNWTLVLNGDRRDDWLGGGVTSASIAWTTGKLGIDNAAAAAIDDTTARSAGRFDKYSLAASRQQRLSDATSLIISYNGQFAGKNLDSAEKFSLGGAFGVRAYPQGEASADEGHLLNLELRHVLRETWQAVAFVDAGSARINKIPWLADTNTRHLEGAGLGLNWASDGWSVNSVLAWKLGSAQPTSDKDRTPRFWLQAARYF